MKKKILFLIIVLFSLVGCSAKYEMDISYGSVYEKVTVTFPYNKDDKELIQAYIDNKQPITNNPYDEKYYEVESKTIGGTVSLSYNYNYTKSEFDDTRLARQCYEYFNYANTNNGILINTSETFNCLTYDYMNLDEIEIVITAKNYDVVETNADKSKNGTYTWIINKDNYQNKPIRLNLKQQPVKEEGKSYYFFIILGISISVLIVLVGLIIFFVKQKQ